MLSLLLCLFAVVQASASPDALNAAAPSHGRRLGLLSSIFGAPRPRDAAVQRFDFLTVLRTPTCINYKTVTNAARYLKPQGLRTVWVVTGKRWLRSIDRWGNNIKAVDEDRAYPGVSIPVIQRLLQQYGILSKDWNGRATAAWYFVQTINLAFVLRRDVLDTLVVHDADQMVLPSYRVWGDATFEHDGGPRKTMVVKIGGEEHRSYDFAFTCLTGGRTLYHTPSKDEAVSDPEGWRHRPLERQKGSFVSHSFTVFRPFMREHLATYTSSAASGGRADQHKADELKHSRRLVVLGVPDTSNTYYNALHAHKEYNASMHVPPRWLENIVRCINPDHPHLGFAESSGYVTYVLHHHAKAVSVDEKRTWTRGDKTSNSLLKSKGSKFCCNVEPLLERYNAMGFEVCATRAHVTTLI